jgi:hypothetical protein
MILTNNPGQSDQNFGGRENMAVGVQPAGQPRHDLVRFDVTALSGQPVVTAARLRLFVTNGGELGGGVDVQGAGNIQVFRVAPANTGWIEGTGFTAAGGEPPDVGQSTWNNRVEGSQPWAGTQGASAAGTDYLATLLTSAPFDATTTAPSSAIDLLFTDVSFFSAWAAGNNPGLFLRIETETAGNAISVASREFPTAAFHPELIVTLSPVPEPSALLLAGLGAAGLAARRRRMRDSLN